MFCVSINIVAQIIVRIDELKMISLQIFISSLQVRDLVLTITISRQIRIIS